MISDYFQLAFERIKHKKLRSLLTALGIIIGVSLVVVLTSISQGMQEAINEQFNFLGYNVIIIEPGAGTITNLGQKSSSLAILDEDDIDVISHAKGVDDAAGVIISNTQVEFKGQKLFTMVRGMPTESSKQKLLRDTFARIDLGSGLKPNDDNTALAGYALTTGKGIFDNKIIIGDKVEIGKKTFKIVGRLKKIGEQHPDNIIAIPLDTAREIFSKPEEFNIIMARASKGYEPDKVAANVKEALRKHRHQNEGEEDFKVTTSQQIVAGFNNVLLVVRIVVIAIAMISIIVGGINIMNTMYTSVLERTKEIGVMKSIGAKNSQVLSLFLVESGMYGLAGGIIGTIAGLSIAKIIEAIIAPKLPIGFFAASISITTIIVVLAFSFFIGVISGITPARQASKLNPVEAIRHE